MVYFFPDWAALIDLRPGYDETTNVYLKITDAEEKKPWGYGFYFEPNCLLVVSSVLCLWFV